MNKLELDRLEIEDIVEGAAASIQQHIDAQTDNNNELVRLVGYSIAAALLISLISSFLVYKVIDRTVTKSADFQQCMAYVPQSNTPVVVPCH